MRAVHAVRIES